MKLLLILIAVVLMRSPAVSAVPGDVTGTVIESMDSGGYTYLLLQAPSGEKRWAAVTKTSVKTGSPATVTGAIEMKNFESPTLRRKFDSIAFGSLAGGEAPAAAKVKNPIHGGRAEVKGPIKVTKATGPDARTVGEVYAEKAGLKGKEVVVSGKVVKYNPAILDCNWAHLRDGTGTAKDGSDDLTVMLKDEAALGKVITVRGRVFLDKDLGGMYKFPVVLEDAVLVK